MRAGGWMIVAMLVAGGCGGRSTLDAFEGGVPEAPDLGGSGARVGEPCESSEDCGDDLSCEGNLPLFGSDVTLPEGYCTVVACQDEAACGAQADCVTTLEDSACLRTCEDDFDCRIGDAYVCSTVGAGGSDTTYCLPGN